jgi:CelD/BcsL family acetyltransferase involved in cellulose biosynthesis
MRLRVTVVRPGELGPGEASLWARFQKSLPELQNPFCSLDFAQAVDRHRGNARVAVVESDGRIQAFLPFDLGPRRIGRPIGDPMNNLQGFISEDPHLDARQVIRKAGLRGWRYSAAPASQRALTSHHYDGTLVQASLIDLSDGYESYFASRSKKFTDDFKQQWRSVERRVGPASVEWGANAPAPIRQLIDWKSARYGGSRELFTDPAARSILAELSVSPTEACGGTVTVLRAGDRVLAVISALTGPGVMSGWFMGHDEEMKKFSPGKPLLLATAEEAARRGISRFELGAGQDAYKSRLSNGSYPVAGGAVWAVPGERAARALYRRFYQERTLGVTEGVRVVGRGVGKGRAERFYPVGVGVEVSLEREVAAGELLGHAGHVLVVIARAGIDAPLGEAQRLAVS